jgi:hypothetical protein
MQHWNSCKAASAGKIACRFCLYVTFTSAGATAEADHVAPLVLAIYNICQPPATVTITDSTGIDRQTAFKRAAGLLLQNLVCLAEQELHTTCSSSVQLSSTHPLYVKMQQLHLCTSCAAVVTLLLSLQDLRVSCAGSSHLSLEDPVFFEDAEAAAQAGSSSARAGGALLGGGCAEIGGQLLLLLAQGCGQLQRVMVSGAPAFRAEVGWPGCGG